MATTAEVRAAKAAYYAANRDVIKARVREYYASHPEQVAAYRAANRDRRNAQRRKWGEANRDRLRVANATRDPEALRVSARAYYAAHAEERRQKSQEWRKANPQKLKEQGRRYRAENPGGEHSYQNVQAAHRRCNSSKGTAIQAA